MIMKNLLVFIFLMVGCGEDLKESNYNTGPSFGGQQPKFSYNVPAEFEQFVYLFIAEGAARGITLHKDPLTVKFGTLGEKVLGECSLDPKVGPTITIDQSKWEGRSDAWKEILLR